MGETASNFLKAILPVIGTAVAGPLGGMAVKFFADKIGVPAEKVADIEQWLKGATPDEILKAKEADQDFQFKMAELGFKDKYAIEQLVVDDRKNARQREISVGDNTTRILAGLYTLGYFGILLVAIFYEFPTENRDVLNALLGALTSIQLTIISYYFGSSRGSSEKTEILNAAIAAKGN